VDLSRNFGKDVALTAGLAHACGDVVIPLDADLQHPPEVIHAMLAKWREGFEVVYAVRDSRKGQGVAHRLLARMFYWVFARVSEVPLPRGAGDFRLLDRKVVDVINLMTERIRFMKGIFSWVGFRQTGVIYVQEPRSEGRSRFGLLKLMGLAFDGWTSFSVFPLRIWGLLGVLVSGAAFVQIIQRLVKTLIYGIELPGYESIFIVVLFLGGVQLLSLGILGDYLGRVFNEVKGRPLYVLRDSYGCDEPHHAENATSLPPREVLGPPTTCAIRARRSALSRHVNRTSARTPGRGR
jgi:polyisoprenyl-phosphate glycosyltransferase